MNELKDPWQLQRVAGGSVTDFAPVYSADGETLFVVWANVVRLFSTSTGEWIRDLEGTNNRLVGIEFGPNQREYLYGCTDAGEVITWEWQADAKNILKLNVEEVSVFEVETFHIVSMKDDVPMGLLSWISEKGTFVRFNIFNLINGEQSEFEFKPFLTFDKLAVAASIDFNYFALIQNHSLFVVHGTDGEFKKWKNIKKDNFTVVACHPSEELVATGDVLGRILLWRKIFEQVEPMTRLYHWHHTQITTLAFSHTGMTFYSGGLEHVLVRWNMKNTAQRDFLPRMQGTPKQIVLTNDNTKIAVCTNDNGIQILNQQFRPVCLIQNFNWIPAEASTTLTSKYPVGLIFNPRTNSIMMNGRIGHLQFFSTLTKRMLYNMDITMQNYLAFERGKELFNIEISHVAISKEWMVTGEILNDFERLPELRMKFWQFKEADQTYSLTTQIEHPHHRGFTAIELANSSKTDVNLCVSTGLDKCLKLWTLIVVNEHQNHRTWQCVQRITYRDYPIYAVQFSQDNSLIAAGFGNSVCIYKSKTMELKCVLNPPNRYSETSNYINVVVGTGKDNSKKSDNELDSNLMANLKKFKTGERKFKQKKLPHKLKKEVPMSLNVKHSIFRFTKNAYELNLKQKLKIYQYFSIQLLMPEKIKANLMDYCTATDHSIDETIKAFDTIKSKVGESKRFRAAYCRFLHKVHNTEKSLYRQINVEGLIKDEAPNRKRRKSECETVISNDKDNCGCILSDDNIGPLTNNFQIRKILFGLKEFSNYLIECTDSRVFIWDLFSMRIKFVLKLSVKHISCDPMTGLMVAFTKKNELYVFHPNAPLPVYSRANLPDIFGFCWVPKLHPKARSTMTDWQARSQLYFLSTKQEMLTLINEKDKSTEETATIHGIPEQNKTPFGALIAERIINSVSYEKSKSANSYPQSNTKEITRLSMISMIPKFYCKTYLKSFSQLSISADQSDTKSILNQKIDESENEEEDDEEEQLKLNERKLINNLIHEKKKAVASRNHVNREKSLVGLMNNSHSFTL